MRPANVPLCLTPGTTHRSTLRIMQPTWVYKPITSITPTAPVQLLAVVDTGTMTLIGTPTVDVISETAGATSWALALGTTGDTLNLTATGEAARTIRWSGYLDSAESA